jgi:hypothetical protein
MWSFEPALLALLVVAAVAWLVRRARGVRIDDPELRRDAWVVLVFVVPYALVLALYERTYERFAIPLVPFAAVAAAYAVERVHGVVKVPRIVLALVVLALPIAATWSLASIRAAPHTSTRAAEWLEQNAAPSDDVALTPGVDLPLAREPRGFASWMGPIEDQFTWPWSRYQARLAGGRAPPPLWNLRWWRPRPLAMAQDPASYVAEQGGALVVLEVFAENRVHPGATKVREHLRRTARLLTRISPDGDPDACEHPLGYQEETSVAPPHFTARVLGARGTGPVLEIYALAAR